MATDSDVIYHVLDRRATARMDIAFHTGSMFGAPTEGLLQDACLLGVPEILTVSQGSVSLVVYLGRMAVP